MREDKGPRPRERARAGCGCRSRCWPRTAPRNLRSSATRARSSAVPSFRTSWFWFTARIRASRSACFPNSSSPWLAPLLVVSSAAVMVLLVWMIVTGRAGGALAQCGLALILGGAAGNALDRVIHGGVTDFLEVRLWNVHLARVQRRRFRDHDRSGIGALRIVVWRRVQRQIPTDGKTRDAV